MHDKCLQAKNQMNFDRIQLVAAAYVNLLKIVKNSDKSQENSAICLGVVNRCFSEYIEKQDDDLRSMENNSFCRTRTYTHTHAFPLRYRRECSKAIVKLASDCHDVVTTMFGNSFW